MSVCVCVRVSERICNSAMFFSVRRTKQNILGEKLKKKTLCVSVIEQNKKKKNKENKRYKSPVEELRQPQLLLIQLNKELCFKLSREEWKTKKSCK